MYNNNKLCNNSLLTEEMTSVRDVILFNAGAIIERILKWLSMIFHLPKKETGSVLIDSKTAWSCFC